MEEKRNFKNKIITFSGQPVAGKGTAVKALIEKLKKRGYQEENIHVISTGNEFRAYHNKIMDLIQSLNNPQGPKKLSETEEIRTIFQNAEYRKALIDSLINLKRNKIDISKISNIEEANNLKELRPIRKVLDTIIDESIKQKGVEINQEEHLNEIWLIDSRLAFHNIPEAFSVRLTANSDVAAERLLNDKTRGKEDKYKTLEEAKIAREKRKIGEQERYKERYGVDLEDENNYNLVIDTSYANIEDISNTILTSLDCYMQNKDFAKKWRSTKKSTLIPCEKLEKVGNETKELEH